MRKSQPDIVTREVLPAVCPAAIPRVLVAPTQMDAVPMPVWLKQLPLTATSMELSEENDAPTMIEVNGRLLGQTSIKGERSLFSRFNRHTVLRSFQLLQQRSFS